MKLSIITINYNNAEGLERTIQSIISQNYINFEYIVIDGASSDKSVDILKKYADKITFWSSEPDSGIYNAMNKGIMHAKGEYILFINSGDIIQAEKKIEDLIPLINGEDFIYFDLKISDNTNTFIKSYPDNLDIKYFLEDSLPHNATFIKRDLFLKYGNYNEDMRICSDWAFFFKQICFKKCTYKHIKLDFSIFYADGISSKPENLKAIFEERRSYLSTDLPQLLTLYDDWIEKREVLYKIKSAKSIRLIKKIGLLKWFNL